MTLILDKSSYDDLNELRGLYASDDEVTDFVRVTFTIENDEGLAHARGWVALYGADQMNVLRNENLPWIGFKEMYAEQLGDYTWVSTGVDEIVAA